MKNAKSSLLLWLLLGFVVALILISIAFRQEEGDEESIVNINEGASGEDCEVKNTCWGPSEITIEPGTTVVWVNMDISNHTVTSGDVRDPNTWAKIFDSGFSLIKPSEQWEFTFTEPGQYPYFCRLHPWMYGIVIVQ